MSTNGNLVNGRRLPFFGKGFNAWEKHPGRSLGTRQNDHARAVVVEQSYLANRQWIVALHQHLPTPLAHSHHEHLDLSWDWRRALLKAPIRVTIESIDRRCQKLAFQPVCALA